MSKNIIITIPADKAEEYLQILQDVRFDAENTETKQGLLDLSDLLSDALKNGATGRVPCREF